MRTVVKKFVGTEREITDSMVHLSNYYDFKIRLCQPRKGNEKGHVERSVDFIRRKAFSEASYNFVHTKTSNEMTDIYQAIFKLELSLFSKKRKEYKERNDYVEKQIKHIGKKLKYGESDDKEELKKKQDCLKEERDQLTEVIEFIGEIEGSKQR